MKCSFSDAQLICGTQCHRISLRIYPKAKKNPQNQNTKTHQSWKNKQTKIPVTDKAVKDFEIQVKISLNKQV